MKIGMEKIFAGIFAIAMMAVSGYAYAASDGCDKETNDRISAELALCTTHAYNIGSITNPINDSDRQLMRDVIALKTTVMTQQMYKQYEYLDATIKRMKTQLEKAILTTKMQAAGASTSDSSSGSSSSKNSNQVLNGAYDCIAESSRTAGFDCLARNLNLVRSAASSGDYGNASRQLRKDYSAFETWAPSSTSNKAFVTTACKDVAASKSAVETCINQMNAGLVNAREEYERANRTTKKD